MTAACSLIAVLLEAVDTGELISVLVFSAIAAACSIIATVLTVIGYKGNSWPGSRLGVSITGAALLVTAVGLVGAELHEAQKDDHHDDHNKGGKGRAASALHIAAAIMEAGFTAANEWLHQAGKAEDAKKIVEAAQKAAEEVARAKGEPSDPSRPQAEVTIAQLTAEAVRQQSSVPLMPVTVVVADGSETVL